MRKIEYAGKKESDDSLEGKAEVRGEAVSCSDSVSDDCLLLTDKQPGRRGPEV